MCTQAKLADHPSRQGCRLGSRHHLGCVNSQVDSPVDLGSGGIFSRLSCPAEFEFETVFKLEFSENFFGP